MRDEPGYYNLFEQTGTGGVGGAKNGGSGSNSKVTVNDLTPDMTSAEYRKIRSQLIDTKKLENFI
jgi:hypothetical protein